ncbi:SLC13 family permease [Fervidibacillus halotolerans]|uniref:Sodium-dependent dicarboxylate transporter SdcS n=1 Tax=Fervidibacillus halotolerans TaxID=2980027 RepID=A0A9E8M1H7_9BACI|nr:SLC13 family permease [Fervidibacillus halotolerans]WAA13519.1 SLC13 family permease [Fervidibacillus halotolerans]
MGTFSMLQEQLWGMHEQTKTILRFIAMGQTPQRNTDSSQPMAAKKNVVQKPRNNMRKRLGLILGPILFFFILFGISPKGMSDEAIGVLASTVWIATWWITEAIPIPATSLLPAILFPLTGAIDDIGSITSEYGNKNIFLFLGGFIIAIGMEKWNLHRRIALNIILFVGTNTNRLVLGFMVATGFISMWISNTATAMMMLPIALAVITHVTKLLEEQKKTMMGENFGKAIMLGIAYSASIGGLGTLIGTPPNVIFASVVEELFHEEISFATWMAFGVPLSVILIAFTWIYLIKIAFPLKMKEIPGGRDAIVYEKRKIGRMSFEEKLVLTVFSLTAFAWITRSFLLKKLIPRIDDTLIALTAAVVLFLLPSKQSENRTLLNWDDAKKVPWGILLLFGGGLAIAKGFSTTGLAQWIGEQLTVLQNIHFIFMIVIVTALVIFLTEITSNTATATMMFPIMASLAIAINVHPFVLMVAAGLAASCAFMLPVATPPNAIVFGSGELKITDMVKAGFWMNIVSIIIISIFVYFYLPFAWGIEPSVFPDSFK